MKVMVIPIVIGALRKITKELTKGLEDSEIRGKEKIYLNYRSARILRRVLET